MTDGTNTTMRQPRPATRMLHADAADCRDVAPPLHVSTTFALGAAFNDAAARAAGWLQSPTLPADHSGRSLPADPSDHADPADHVYSRESSAVRSRLETVLGALEPCFAVTYASGLSAIFAALQLLQPRRILISSQGYHGSHGALDLYMRGRPSIQVFYIENDTQDHKALHSLESGDLIWLESPQNPRGEIADLQFYVAHKKPGVILGVDSTFAPPPIQEAIKHGADIVMHSSTKFLGGHSDLLGGVLMTRNPETHKKLLSDRTFMGSVMGSMEAWLLLRSMRTFRLRIMQQSDTAARLACWLDSRLANQSNLDALDVVERVWHASLPDHPGHEAAKRQGEGWPGVLSIEFTSHHYARLICTNLRYFQNATSLGGCESLIEWRYPADPKISPKLCRLSIGLEDAEDLQDDLCSGFETIRKIVARDNLI